jgi:molybdopterin converting factor small subunit
MENEVEFYGMIAEKIGVSKSSILLDIHEEDLNLRDTIMSVFPELTTMTFQIAVNNELRENLSKDDLGKTIAILPPFAGG